MKIKLIRLEKCDDGVLGMMLIDGVIFCATLEPEDKGNQRNISCIPAGNYTCKRYHSLKYPETYIVRNVPNRDLILFHAGNTEDDSHGCILLGKYHDRLKGKRAVLNSGETFKKFLKHTEEYDILELEIIYG